MKKILISLIGVLCLIPLVMASLTVNQPSSAYSTINSTSVNLSTTFSQTTNGETNFKLVVYNKTSSAGSYGTLFTANITNGSMWNHTFTFADSSRQWVYYSVINNTGGPTSSGAYVFDIDTSYNKLMIGGYNKLNFTPSTGLIETDYGIKIGLADGTEGDCGATTRGLIIYNNSRGFMGCTSLGWTSLNGSLV